jgi:SAM-dependent methyltransferase
MGTIGGTVDRTILDRILALGFDYAQQPMNTVNCNLCESSDLTVIAGMDRYGQSVRVVQCDHCGLVFHNPRMTKEAYAEFYAKWYRLLVKEHSGRDVSTETLAAEAKGYGYGLCPNLEPVLRGRFGQSLLDIGGSTGVVAHILADAYGLTATVLDPSREELKHAKSLGLRTIHALFEDWQPEGHYDVITLFQTIDHLLDIKGALAKVRSLLNPGGVFIFDICEWEATKRWAGCLEQAIKIDHPYYLTNATTEKYLESAGLRAVGRGEACDGRKLFYVCEAVT